MILSDCPEDRSCTRIQVGGRPRPGPLAPLVLARLKKGRVPIPTAINHAIKHLAPLAEFAA